MTRFVDHLTGDQGADDREDVGQGYGQPGNLHGQRSRFQLYGIDSPA